MGDELDKTNPSCSFYVYRRRRLSLGYTNSQSVDKCDCPGSRFYDLHAHDAVFQEDVAEK